MQSSLGATLLLLACASMAPAEGEKDSRSPSPAERYQALVKQYHETSLEFRKAATDEERKAAVEHLAPFPLKFLELAEQHPEEPIAVDAAVELVRTINAVDSLTMTSWEMSTTTFPAALRSEAPGRAVALLLRHHARSDKIGPVCQRMSYGIRKEFEPFLRSVLQLNPHRDVQALACLSLARLLNTRVQKLDVVKDRPEFAARYEDLFGKDHFEELQRQGRAKIAVEVETLLERAASEYGDEKIPFAGTARETAEAELYEMRYLAVGKIAPEIEGVDQDARPFKLSEYRGKVVLLDFWQEY